jgi:hypothetical protein
VVVSGPVKWDHEGENPYAGSLETKGIDKERAIRARPGEYSPR